MASRPPEFTPPPSDDQARARFIVINAVRLTGVILTLLGILVFQGVLDLPEVAGWTFVVIGLFEVFVMPQILARKWRTPPE
jgi:predicted branched-subunit amino acid permease